MTDYLELQSESNKLKLTAADEMIDVFDELESLTEQSMNIVNEMLQRFSELMADASASEEFQARLQSLADKSKLKAKLLIQLMRHELSNI